MSGNPILCSVCSALTLVLLLIYWIFITDRIKWFIDKSKEGHGIALNIFKTFEGDWHAALLYKFSAYRLCGEVFEVIKPWISDRFVRVTLDGVTSSEYSINAGVPQRFIFHPNLFNFISFSSYFLTSTVFLSMFFNLSMFLLRTLPLFLSSSLSLFQCLSLSISLSLSLCLTGSLFLSLFHPLSPSPLLGLSLSWNGWNLLLSLM